MALQTVTLEPLVNFALAGSGSAPRTYLGEDGLLKFTSLAGPRKNHEYISTDDSTNFVIPGSGQFNFSVDAVSEEYLINDTVSIQDALTSPTKKVVARVLGVAGSSLIAQTLSIVGSGTITNAKVVHLRPKGLLVEPTRRNHLYNTRDMSTGWTANNLTAAASDRVSSDGTVAGRKLTDTSTSIGVSNGPTVSITSLARNWVYSVECEHGDFQTEPGGLNTAELGYLRINSQFGGVAYAQTALFDAINGQIKQLNSTSGFVNCGVEKLSSKRFRFWLTCKTDSDSTSVQVGHAPGIASSQSVDNAALFVSTVVQNPNSYGQHYFDNAMLESGVGLLGPSSYVPNTSSSASVADSPDEVAQIVGANFPNAFNPASAGTIVVEALAPRRDLNRRTVAALADGAGNNAFELYRNSAGNRASADVKKASGTVTLDGTGVGEAGAFSWDQDSIARIAFSWDATAYSLAVNGTLIDSDVPASGLPVSIDRFNIGSLLDTSAGGQGGFHIRDVRGYKSRISSSQLSSLSALVE